MNTSTDWFASWFDTDYYHILYKNRDQKEAQVFMENLVSHIDLKKDDLILDLPCGKGRHSIFLNSLGFNVVGADLSKNSIDFANQFQNEKLRFVKRDMRDSLKLKYDAIFCLFTSFGYFEDDNDDIQILKNMKNGLKSDDSIIVIDFLNVKKTVANLVKEETVTRDNITFKIRRFLKDGFIVKEIDVIDNNKTYQFFERIKYLDLKKLQSYISKTGLQLKETIGNYNLKPFDEENSDRLILIISK